MPKQSHDAIPGFTSVAPTIWECPASTNLSSTISQAESPDLILLFSWTGASGKHVSKYTRQYQFLFPMSRIMVITTSIKDLILRSSTKRQSRLLPAIGRILSYGNLNRILVHAFSEGGSNKATELAEVYRIKTGQRLPCAALCLDSTPGMPRYLRLCDALRKSLPPNPIIRWAGIAFGSLVLGGVWMIWRGFKGTENNPVTRTRGRLNDDTFWDLHAPRSYLFSRNDAIIAWQDIHEHAQESRRKGVEVFETMFESSAHCNHTVEDPTRYWFSVWLTWKQGLLADRIEAIETDATVARMEKKPEMGNSPGVAKAPKSSNSSITICAQDDPDMIKPIEHVVHSTTFEGSLYGELYSDTDASMKQSNSDAGSGRCLRFDEHAIKTDRDADREFRIRSMYFGEDFNIDTFTGVDLTIAW